MNEILDKKEIRKEILHLEDVMRKRPDVLIGDNPQFPLKHTFAPGVYVREIFIPKGSLIVGKIHKHSHPNFLMSGEVSVLTEEGVKKYTAPFQGITKAGTKRIIYHHDEVIFTTVHSTKETDIDKIEVEVIAQDFEGLEDKLEAENIIDFIEVIKRSEI